MILCSHGGDTRFPLRGLQDADCGEPGGIGTYLNCPIRAYSSLALFPRARAFLRHSRLPALYPSRPFPAEFGLKNQPRAESTFLLGASCLWEAQILVCFSLPSLLGHSPDMTGPLGFHTDLEPGGSVWAPPSCSPVRKRADR